MIPHSCYKSHSDFLRHYDGIPSISLCIKAETLILFSLICSLALLLCISLTDDFPCALRWVDCLHKIVLRGACSKLRNQQKQHQLQNQSQRRKFDVLAPRQRNSEMNEFSSMAKKLVRNGSYRSSCRGLQRLRLMHKFVRLQLAPQLDLPSFSVGASITTVLM
ncbi:hypothetical protein V6N13_104883 [Hibiscus sabdariffa]|uniref:Uncharacterized protein n=1 Tax=Hibiscus sabdariffa TaxID=183260 RepID=A0ABR2SJ40_9ROSI